MQALAINPEPVAYLVRLHPPTRWRIYPFCGEVVIGRSSPCQIIIRSDTVSRHHATLERHEEGWTVRDLDSVNGLFVNGERVQRQLLTEGDIIRVGTTLLRFEAAMPALEAADGGLVGRGLAAQRAQLRQAAAGNRPVILVGDAGTGKSVAAAYLHQARCPAPGPMVRVSCAAVSPNQLEQLARTATGGTLFLRGAGALSVRCQRRLARALDETTLLVLSTREALPRLEPRLEARLANKLEIQIPPLARHPQDIPELVQHFVGVHEVRALVDVELMERLCCSRWPGNVRELEQAVMRLGQPESQPITERDPGDVRAELMRTLRLHVGDVAAAATALGISRSQLYRRAARLGVRVADLRWHGR